MHGHVRVCRAENLRGWVERRDGLFDGHQVMPLHEVALVQDDEVGELDLLRQELRHETLAVFHLLRLAARTGFVAETLDEICGGHEVSVERVRVDDGHARIEACHLLQRGGAVQRLNDARDGFFIARIRVGREGFLGDVDAEHLGDLRGLGNATRLDDDDVEAARAGEIGEGLDEVRAQGAAHAAVLELHDLVHVVQRASVSDEGRVDVE